MATLYISEFTATMSAAGSTISEKLPQPPVAEQTVAIGATAAKSNAFNANTKAIRLMADAVCSILISATGTGAAATNARLAANVPEYFGVPGGYFLSVITNS